MSNDTLPVAKIGDASKGEGTPAGSVINAERDTKPFTVGSAPTVKRYAGPPSSSSTNSGVEPPQQSHAGQLGFGVPSKMVKLRGTPSEGGEGIGASPCTKVSSSL